MKNFSTFFNQTLKDLNLDCNKDFNIDEIRIVINKFNEYFFTNHAGIGQTYQLDDYYEYFSEFHKFWEQYHEKILNPTIDYNKCSKVADALFQIYKNYGEKPFRVLYETYNIAKEDVCTVRYFSINQDFRGSRDVEKLLILFRDDPSIFDVKSIFSDPGQFLKNIGITKLSQNDKREMFAKNAAKMLLDNNISAYNLLNFKNQDVIELENFLISNKGAGFGNKKAEVFIRDMIVLKVWDKYKNFENLSVPSDINTIKVALRTGILKTEIPLLSSFLDIFCYQYTLIDNYNSRAWKAVWDIWFDKYPEKCIESPILIDFLIYRIIGKEFCKESLIIFECETGNHRFKWHSSRNKTCQICYKNNYKEEAKIINRLLPCMDDEGYMCIENSKFVTGKDAILPGLKICPFVIVCEPRNKNFIKFNPPKSISILGQTGWESAKTRRYEGGGGLMS